MNKMLLIKKTIFIGMLILMCSLLSSKSYASNIYVDQTLASDCSSGNYSVSNRNCSGSDGKAYNTIQKAINICYVGDRIFMRGGKYLVSAVSPDPVAIRIPLTKNGTSWTEGNYILLASYPGEWAIIDGQGTSPIVLGYYSYAKDGTTAIKYWWFERFEVTGGVDRIGDTPGGGGAIWVNDGPNKFRYLYIHDNIHADSGYNNPSGIVGMTWSNSLVEYCYFKDNGCTKGVSSNCANLTIYSDYLWSTGDLIDINHAQRQNEIRFNLFDGSNAGVKDKGGQLLGDRTGTDMEYKDYGDKVHHNIFLNESIAVFGKQDFKQIYNNISNIGIIYDGESCGSCITMLNNTIYNNTITGASSNIIWHATAYTDPYAPVNYHPYFWDVNNIVDGYTNTWETSSITAGSRMVATGGTVDMTDGKIDRDFIYRPGSSTHLYVGRNAGLCSGLLTVSDYNICYGVTNYTNSTTGLYKGSSGADKYITNGSFVIGSTTIANGGIGGNHPYLTGVKLPSYVGATNPNDPKNNAWVNGVLSLSNVNVLKESKGIPSWSPSTVGWQ